MRPSLLSVSLCLSSTVAIAAVHGVHSKTKVEHMAQVVPFFERAQAVQGGRSIRDAQIDAVFAQRVNTPRD